MHTTPSQAGLRNFYRYENKMPRVLDTYYSLEGGLSYNTFLRHFQDQAKGAANITLIKDINSLKGDARFRKQAVNNTLILVDLASEEKVNAKKEKQPPVRVIDPTELTRLRANDRVAAESCVGASSSPYKNDGAGAESHSELSTHGRKRSVKRKRGNLAAKSSKRAIKRARDIFED